MVRWRPAGATSGIGALMLLEIIAIAAVAIVGVLSIKVATLYDD